MFEADLDIVAQAIDSLSRGRLHCLPYARYLIDYFDQRGIHSRPLVARPVVFGVPNGSDWNELLRLESPQAYFDRAVGSPHANGHLQLTIPTMDTESRTVSIPYRTLGYSHNDSPVGTYNDDGTWNGHIVVLAENSVLDMTIGQLNDVRFHIHFDPPHVEIESDNDFLSGNQLLVGTQDGMMIAYRAFPEETTFQESRSWSDADFRNQLQDAGIRAAAAYSQQHPISDFQQ